MRFGRWKATVLAAFAFAAPHPVGADERLPLGLPPLLAPEDNPPTADKVALGRLLFWDGRLSKSGTTSCSTCHNPDKAWADGLALSKRDDATINTRHTPSLLNAAYSPTFFWDGRAPTLERQIAADWREQMGVKTDADAAATAKRLSAVKVYADQFQSVFSSAPTRDTITKALSSYVRTLLSGSSKVDRFEAGQKGALNAAELRGYELFKDKAKCALCHAGALWTAWEFRNIGLPGADSGRGKIEPSNPSAAAAFKVPSLRGVARSAPYMHDGRFATLGQVLDHYGRPVQTPALDPRLKGGIALTPTEKKDLLAFLKALDGSVPDGRRPKPAK